VLLFEGAHLLQRVMAQRAGPVGRAEDRGVESADDVVAGRATLDLEHRVLRDLLRGDELHLLVRGDGGELLEGEEAVLAGVDEDAPVGFVEDAGGARVVRREGGAERARRGLDPPQVDALAADRPEGDALPGDHRRRLDLLDLRRAGGAAHQEEEHRVGAGQRALRHQGAARPLLGVGVGDVEAHAAGAGGADLDVGPGAGLGQTADHHLDVADQPRHVERLEHRLDRLRGQRIGVELLADRVGCGEDVAVGDPGRRVDAVDDDVGARLGEQPVEGEVGVLRLLERADLRPHLEAPQRGVVEAGQGLRVEAEEIAGGDGQRGVARLVRQLLGGAARFLFAQAVDLDLARPADQQLAAHGGADHAVAAEHQHLLSLDVHLASFRTVALFPSPSRPGHLAPAAAGRYRATVSCQSGFASGRGVAGRPGAYRAAGGEDHRGDSNG
jgi:hypothetical protein